MGSEHYNKPCNTKPVSFLLKRHSDFQHQLRVVELVSDHNKGEVWRPSGEGGHDCINIQMVSRGF